MRTSRSVHGERWDAAKQRISLVLCTPVQSFLNEVFKAEKLTSAFVLVALHTPERSVLVPDSAMEKEAEAFKQNWVIFFSED